MSDLFSIYEDKFNDLITKIKMIISTFTNLSREKAESALSSSVSLFKEALNVLNQMEIETSANGTLPSLNKVKQYKNEFYALQNKFQTIQDNYITQKAETAIILGTDNNSIDEDSCKRKNTGLIDNEHGNEEIKFDSVGITNSFEFNKREAQDLHQDKLPETLEIHEGNDLMFKKEKKNKMVLIISSVVVIVVLIILIILLSIFH